MGARTLPTTASMRRLSTEVVAAEREEDRVGGSDEATSDSAVLARRRPAFAADGAFSLIRETLGLGRSLWLDASGDSMYPVLRGGNRVLLAPRERAPRAGDIVLARFGQRLVLHRVSRVVGSNVILRGDASEQPDPTVAGAETIGIAVACADGRGVRGLTPTLRYGLVAFARQLMLEAHRRARASRYRRS